MAHTRLIQNMFYLHFKIRALEGPPPKAVHLLSMLKFLAAKNENLKMNSLWTYIPEMFTYGSHISITATNTVNLFKNCGK